MPLKLRRTYHNKLQNNNTIKIKLNELNRHIQKPYNINAMCYCHNICIMFIEKNIVNYVDLKSF